MTSQHRFALVGDPVEHSRSPEIHDVLLDLSGLEGDYTTITADRAGLVEEIAGLRNGSWHGLNVTMPLKRDAAELADRLAPEASRAGSVNTLELTEGAVVGHSTDCLAFSVLFEDPRFHGEGSILLLGAGGSAAAALAALGPDSVTYVSARRPEEARSMLDRMGDQTRNPGLQASPGDAGNPGVVIGEVVPWGTAVAGAVVVNTTPLGMAGETLPGRVLDGARGLIDLPYGERRTPAVTFAMQEGVAVADGHEFLVRQAIASFAIWTGEVLPLDAVMARLRKA